VKAISGALTPDRSHHLHGERRDSTEPRRVTNDLENVRRSCYFFFLAAFFLAAGFFAAFFFAIILYLLRLVIRTRGSNGLGGLDSLLQRHGRFLLHLPPLQPTGFVMKPHH
jgi:hypothetical protein